jgi:hypothetical protein
LESGRDLLLRFEGRVAEPDFLRRAVSNRK